MKRRSFLQMVGLALIDTSLPVSAMPVPKVVSMFCIKYFPAKEPESIYEQLKSTKDWEPIAVNTRPLTEGEFGSFGGMRWITA